MKSKTEFYQSYFEALQRKGFTVQPSSSPDYVADIYHKDKLIAFYTKHDLIMKNPFVEVQDKLMDRVQTLAQTTAVACGICSDKPFDEETSTKLRNDLYKINEHNGVVLACKQHPYWDMCCLPIGATKTKIPSSVSIFTTKKMPLRALQPGAA